MFEKLIRFSIEQRWLVLLAALGMAALGVFSYQKLPIDAVPDITNLQVQVITSAPALSPVEVEQYVSVPVERAQASAILPAPASPRAITKRILPRWAKASRIGML